MKTRQFAKFVGVSQPAIVKAEKAGKVVRDKRGRFNPRNKVNRLYIEWVKLRRWSREGLAKAKLKKLSVEVQIKEHLLKEKMKEIMPFDLFRSKMTKFMEVLEIELMKLPRKWPDVVISMISEKGADAKSDIVTVLRRDIGSAVDKAKKATWENAAI